MPYYYALGAEQLDVVVPPIKEPDAEPIYPAPEKDFKADNSVIDLMILTKSAPEDIVTLDAAEYGQRVMYNTSPLTEVNVPSSGETLVRRTTATAEPQKTRHRRRRLSVIDLAMIGGVVAAVTLLLRKT